MDEKNMESNHMMLKNNAHNFINFYLFYFFILFYHTDYTLCKINLGCASSALPSPKTFGISQLFERQNMQIFKYINIQIKKHTQIDAPTLKVLHLTRKVLLKFPFSP